MMSAKMKKCDIYVRAYGNERCNIMSQSISQLIYQSEFQAQKNISYFKPLVYLWYDQIFLNR